MAVTHEQSLRACAAYRALASDGRFRRLCVIVDASGSRLERVKRSDEMNCEYLFTAAKEGLRREEGREERHCG